MHRFLQLVCYFCTFVSANIVGYVLSTLSWQAPSYWSLALGGKILPGLTHLSTNHFGVHGHLSLFPWLALVGLPLVFPSRERSYWDSDMFVLRLITFAVAEITLVLGLLFSLLVPAFGILMSSPPRSDSPFEVFVRCLYWLSVCVVVLSGLRLLLRHRRALRPT